MTSLDDRIGANLTRLRADRSQRDLAALMRTRGWKWSHVTVGLIEKGERPLRLAEAVDVAAVLGQDVRYLLEPTANVAWNDAYVRLDRARRSFELGLSDYYNELLSVVLELGDVTLSDEQEDALREFFVDSASRIVAAKVKGDLFEHADTLLDGAEELRPDMKDRFERIRRRLGWILESWRRDAARSDAAMEVARDSVG